MLGWCRRVEELEIALKEIEPKNSQFAVFQGELTHLNRLLEEHARMEEKERDDLTTALTNITSELTQIRVEMSSHPEKLELLGKNIKESVLTKCYETFSTKEVVEKEIKEMKSKAWIVFTVITAVATAFSWVLSILLKGVMH